jgi:hypothetical protein
MRMLSYQAVDTILQKSDPPRTFQRGIDFSIEFRNCSDSVVFDFLFVFQFIPSILLLIRRAQMFHAVYPFRESFLYNNFMYGLASVHSDTSTVPLNRPAIQMNSFNDVKYIFISKCNIDVVIYYP